VSSIYENYVWHYAYISEETYREYFDEDYEPNTIYVNVTSDCDVYEKGAKLGDIDGMLNVLVINEQKDRVANMMKVMNSVVLLVIGCAGALAFIVLFNLSNINITERVREIATIKVLGFYPMETGSYVFRENLVLTIMGIIIGVPLGVILHSFVMSQINIDMVAFKVVILPKSYVIGIFTVLLFLVVVDLVMRRKIEKIDMAESLKSVE
jgi:putative ABC transport system permease protein